MKIKTMNTGKRIYTVASGNGIVIRKVYDIKSGKIISQSAKLK